MTRKNAPFPLEFRRQMVELVRTVRPPGELSREFEASAQAIRNRVVQAVRDAGRRGDGPAGTERRRPGRVSFRLQI